MNKPRYARILIVTRNLPPLVGGMERLNWHMAEELAKVAEVRVVGPDGCQALAPDGVTMCEAPLKPLWKFLWRARALARHEARRWKPDIVLAGSGLTAPLAASAARTCGARTAVYVHGLDVAVKSLVYRTIWLPAIRRADRVIANSHATAELCRGAGVESSRVGIVHPGVELPPAAPDPSADNAQREAVWRDAFRQRHALGDGPLMLSVGRLSSRKGLREFVAQALPRIITAYPDAMLLIVGDAPRDALHAEAQTQASIQAAASQAGVGDNVRFLGVITDYNELGAIYRASDVHVFPVREIPGDPEGFGMVAVEAAAHGLPTVAFATGGIVDAVAEDESGHLVRPRDYITFAESVARTIAEGDSLSSSCYTFARKFAWLNFGVELAHQIGLSGGAIPLLNRPR